MIKASFKTGYDQREIALDVAVTADLHVGQLATLVAANSGKPAYLQAASTKEAATHIIAQSDMTMEYGHVPVEYRDYKYTDVVARTEAGTVSATSVVKKVAVFEIKDKNDLLVYEA